MPNSNLLDRWLTALRASGPFAQGRECDYAMTEHDADRYDPIGLLAQLADVSELHWTHTTGNRGEFTCAPGASLDRRVAHSLALEVGLDPIHLVDLCTMCYFGCTGSEMAEWIEARVG
jgi:hypothetical protein